MEYLDLIKKFWRIEDINLNASATNMYLFLLEIWDRKDKKDFEFSDKELSSRLKINRKTIKINKDILRNIGLISYQTTKGFPTFYKIIPDYNINRKPSVIIKEKEPSAEIKDKKDVSTKSAIKKTKEPVSDEISISVEKVKENLNSKNNNSKIPSLDEFMEYARSLEIYNETFDQHLKIKYEGWKQNGWVNGYGKPITNWKQTLINTIPYLNKSTNNIFDIPKINRPKNTYNE